MNRNKNVSAAGTPGGTGPVSFFDPNQFNSHASSGGGAPTYHAETATTGAGEDSAAAAASYSGWGAQQHWDATNWSYNANDGWQGNEACDPAYATADYAGNYYGQQPVDPSMMTSAGQWAGAGADEYGNQYEHNWVAGQDQQYNNYQQMPQGLESTENYAYYGQQATDMELNSGLHSDDGNYNTGENNFPQPYAENTEGDFSATAMQPYFYPGEDQVPHNLHLESSHPDAANYSQHEDGSHQAAAMEPAIKTVDNDLPTVNSFNDVVHQPSPFDELFGEKPASHGPPSVASHSRQSSTGGVHFLLGGSENASESHSTTDSPRAFVADAVSASAIVERDGDSSASVEEANPANLPAAALAADFLQASQTDSGSHSNPGRDVCVPSVLTAQPTSVSHHSTMAGTPHAPWKHAVNQGAENMNEHRALSQQAPIPLQTGTDAKFSRGSHPHHEVVADAFGNMENIPLDFPASLHSPGGGESLGSPRSDAGINSDEDHRLNIYASPIFPHPNSSFTPVGSAAGKPLTAPAGQASSESHSHSTDLVPTSARSGSAMLDANEIENDAAIASGGADVGDLSHLPNAQNDRRPPTDVSEIASDRKTPVGRAKDASHVTPTHHKYRREAMMSPATTLWENPEPPGIRLVPTPATQAAASGSTIDKSAFHEFPQNTGTGPSRSKAGASDFQRPLSPLADGNATPHILDDQQVPQTPGKSSRQASHSDHFAPPSVMAPASNNPVSTVQPALRDAPRRPRTPISDAVRASDSVDSLTQEFAKTSLSSPFGSNPSHPGAASFSPPSVPLVFQSNSGAAAESGPTGPPRPENFPPGFPQAQPPNSGAVGNVANVPQNLPVSMMPENYGPVRARNPVASPPKQESTDSKAEPEDPVLSAWLRPKPGNPQDRSVLSQQPGQTALPQNSGLVSPPQSQVANPAYRDRPAQVAAGRDEFIEGGRVSAGKERNIRGGFTEQQGNRRDFDSQPVGDVDRYRDGSRSGRDRDGAFDRPPQKARDEYDELYDATRERQGYEDEQRSYNEFDARHGGPASRQDSENSQNSRGPAPRRSDDDFESPRSRPDSRQRYDDPYDRPSSRSGYEDRRGRPSSRQGDAYEDQRYKRGDRRDYDYADSRRPGSELDYDDLRDRPRSRQEDPTQRPNSRQGYDDRREYDRSREQLRQGLPDDSRNPRSRPVVDDRPRSKQENPPTRRDYRDDEGYSRSRNPRGGYRERESDDRPRSRPDYYDERGGLRHSASYQDEISRRPLSRQSRNEEYEKSKRRSYAEEDRGTGRHRDDSRSRSRRDAADRRTMTQDERRRKEYEHHVRERSRERYYDYYNQQYQDYYAYARDYYAQYGMVDPYYSQYAPFYQGFYQEVSRQPQEAGYDDGSRGSAADRESHHSTSRVTTPLDELSSADQFARVSHSGSRPSSVLSGNVDPARGLDYSGYDEDPSGDYPEVPADEPIIPRCLTPEKFIRAHAHSAFGATGRMTHVLPNDPRDGQPTLVEIIDVGAILGATQEASKLRHFPGPLVKFDTHKNDVLHYCQSMAEVCRRDVDVVDRQSAELLWRFLELLIKQNGTLIGTDIADLLLDGHEPVSRSFSRAGRLIAAVTDEENTVTADRSLVSRDGSDSNSPELTDRYRHLLLHGRKKDALDWAVSKNLWGHALFLASKMDTKTHASILTKFTHVSMKANDPLQTLYQLMSGHQPAAAKLMATETWGDWRPHLAMILSNPTQRPEHDRKSVTVLGDTLASRGFLYASQFCYLLVSMMMSRDDVPEDKFGPFSVRSSKIVLLGASHSNCSFETFASNVAAVQCTEIYEYGMSLGHPNFVLPHFLVYKYQYMLRLIDYGFFDEALRYAEVIGRAIVARPQLYPSSMARSVCDLFYRLRYWDLQRIVTEESGDPEWITSLGSVLCAMEDGSIVHQPQPAAGNSVVNSSMYSEFGGADVSMLGTSTFQHSSAAELSFLAAQQPATATIGSSATAATSADVSSGNSQWQYHPSAAYTGYSSATASAGVKFYTQSTVPNQQSLTLTAAVPTVEAGTVATGAVGETSSGNTPWQFQFQPSANSAYTENSATDKRPTDAIDGSYDQYSQQSQQDQPTSRLQQQQQQWSQYQPIQEMSEDSTDGSSNVARNAAEQSAISSTSGTAFNYAAPAPMSRQRTTSSSSSTHSQYGPPSRRGSNTPSSHNFNAPPSSTASYETLPASSDSQLDNGSSAALGVAGGSEQRKKQRLPGEEDDEFSNKKSSQDKGKEKKGLFGGLFDRWKNRPKEMILPDDKDPKIVWDPVKNRYVNKDASGEEVEEESRVVAPPSDVALKQKLMPIMSAANLGGGGAPPSDSGMMFKRAKPRGARDQYVDVLRGTCKPSPNAPSSLFSVLPKSASMPANIFVPNAQAANDDEPEASVTSHHDDHQSSPSQQSQQSSPGSLHPHASDSSTSTNSTSSTGSQLPTSRSAHGAPPLSVGEHRAPMSSAPSSDRSLPPLGLPPTGGHPTGGVGLPPAGAPPVGGPPMMFNPSQFSQQAVRTQPLSGAGSGNATASGNASASAGAGGGLHYGQRRQYPRK